MENLKNQTILLTRPEKESQIWAKAIEKAGGKALCCPLFEILPLSLKEQEVLLKKLQFFLKTPSSVIFISPNAVEQTFLLESDPSFWGKHLLLAAGKSTQKKLEEKGVNAFASPTESAEGLLSFFKENKNVPQQVALLRGDTGRDFLPLRLKEEGKRVEIFSLYTRKWCDEQTAQDLFHLVLEEKISAMVFTSSQAVREWVNLLKIPKLPRVLVELPVFVIHPRIAQTLMRLGFQNVVNTQTGSALVDFLIRYPWKKNG